MRILVSALRQTNRRSGEVADYDKAIYRWRSIGSRLVCWCNRQCEESSTGARKGRVSVGSETSVTISASETNMSKTNMSKTCLKQWQLKVRVHYWTFINRRVFGILIVCAHKSIHRLKISWRIQKRTLKHVQSEFPFPDPVTLHIGF